MFSVLNSMENVRDFNAGLHTVTLLSFGETEPVSRVLDNGETYTKKGTVWFKLKDDKGAVDKHTFYYDTELIRGSNGTTVQQMIEQDADRFLAIKNNILKQIETAHPEIAAATNVPAFFGALVKEKVPFKTIVTEVPSADGTRIFKNYSYNPEEIKLATL